MNKSANTQPRSVRLLSARCLVLYVAVLTAASAVAQSTLFTPGNLVVTVEGCGVQGSNCAGVANGTGTSGGYGDNQAAPLTLFQYAPSGTSAASFVNSLALPQAASGANLPVSGEYGSSSEGTLQLSGLGQYLTILGYGIDVASFNANPANYGAAPSNALAQSGSLTGQSYTPVPRVLALIDANGNVNSSTALLNIFNTNNPRSAFTVDGSSAYVSGQGTGSAGDATGGVFYIPQIGVTNSTPTPITGFDASGNTVAQDTRTIQILNNTLYVSVDSKEGKGNNRSYIGTLGKPPATSLYNNQGGPTMLTGFGNTGGTGKVTISTGVNSNGNNLNAGLAINLSPVNFFLASPSVLYVADTGNPKNDSNGDNDSNASTNIGNGGLEKWVNSKADGSGTWSLAYTLYQNLSLVNNGSAYGTSGLYGLAGVVNSNGTVFLYATNATLSDLDPTYLYGITDTLSFTTASQASSESFTQLAMAPADSNFKGVSFAPTVPQGAVEITSAPSGLGFTASGNGCAPNSYTSPQTLIWTPGSVCTLSVSPIISGAPGVQYAFSQWEDGSTAATRTVSAPAPSLNLAAKFTTEYQLTTSAGAGGSVSAGGYIAAGADATITATPASGYYFVNFTGATTSTDNPLSLAMTAPASITANFAPQTTPVIAWAAPSPITYGTPLSGAQLSATASVPGTFTYTPPLSTVLPAGANQTLSVLFTPADTVHYTAASAVTTITVNKATPNITWSAPTPIIFGTALGAIQLNASASTAGSFVYTPPAGTVLSPGNGQTLSVSFTPNDAVDYTGATASVQINVVFSGAAPNSSKTCNGAYNGTFKGNITVAAGQTCIFYGGTVSGNVTMSGGSLQVVNATVDGNVQAQGGGSITLTGGTVKGNVQVQEGGSFNSSGSPTIQGNLQIQSLPVSATPNEVCGITLKGNLQYQSNGAPADIGSASGCAGNKISGNLQVQSNTAAVNIYNNTARGNIQVQDNTAAVNVFGNSSNGNLQCSGDTSIVGGGNTAREKQQQCAGF